MPGEIVADRVNELYRGEIYERALQRACQDRIHWMCSQVTGEDVLDIGCSQGITSLLLGREGHRVVGVDVDQGAVDYALGELEKEADYVKRNVKFRLAGGEALPFADESFDTILLGELLEHLTRPDRILREAGRLLRPQGRIVITTPFGVHPHPGHVRTFYLASFLGTVGQFFDVHTLRVVDGYINCVAIKPASDREGDAQSWSCEKLILLSEAAFQAKEQRHWEKREKLASTTTTLREDLAKAKADAEALRKSTAESAVRLRELEKKPVGALARVREALRPSNGTLNLDTVLRRVDDAIAKTTAQPADGAFELFPEVVREAVHACEVRLEKLATEHQNLLAELSHRHEADIATLQARAESLKRQHETTLLELTRKHETELATLQRTERDRTEALRRQHEDALAELTRKHKTALAELKRGHEAEIRKLHGELQKTRDLRTRTEEANERLRARVNMLVEYYKVSEQLQLEQVRYRLGDAFVRAFDSPKDLLFLPGRLIKLFFAGLRRRRERSALESPPQSIPSQPALPSAPPAQKAAIPAATASFAPGTVQRGVTAAPAPAPATAPVRKPSVKPANPQVNSRVAGSEVLEKAPFAPHLGTGSDPRATVFARPPGGPRRRVAAILDEFSRDCFAPEFDMVTFRPDNWANVLKATGADLLFVESAWHGNDGSWQYRIGTYPRNVGDELLDLIDCCKRNGVPTVFWNKEDPPHFEFFIKKAALFDVVLTTDENCVPNYRQQLGHDRAYALPFAAQPLIHNPIRTGERIDKACFAGTYYSKRYEHRREDMSMLLRPAMQLGLDIYDRMHNATVKDKENYVFPEEFQPAIRGRLEYPDMVAAYKRYRVFLNVNSVKDSPTMFSRRVFELLACGTPVVSTYSKGVEKMLGPNGVFLVETERDTQRILESLMNDDDAWSRASAKGIRKVLSEHTYADRFAELCQRVGLGTRTAAASRVAVMIPLTSPADVEAAADLVASQHYPNFEVHLFATEELPAGALERVGQASGRPVKCWLGGPKRPNGWREFLDTCSAEIVCCMHTDSLYESSYLADAVAFLRIPVVDCLGKACRFQAISGEKPTLTQQDAEWRMVGAVPSATLCARKSWLNAEALHQMLSEPQFTQSRNSILSTYRYGFLEGMARNTFMENRTWRLDV